MIVAMTVTDRPYLETVLHSWQRALKFFGKPVHFHFQLEPEAARLTENIVRRFGQHPTSIALNDVKMGVTHNPRVAIDTAFRVHPTGMFVVGADDDAVVSKDIFNYFEYVERHRPTFCKAVCSAISGDRARWPQVVGKDDPSGLYVEPEWFTPTNWGTWISSWMYLRDRVWGDPSVENNGWDCTMLSFLKNSGQSAIFPQCSRSEHIGLLGAHNPRGEDEPYQLYKSLRFSPDHDVREFHF